MLEHWSLRRRIFLFFALIGCAGLVAIGGGLWLGYSRLGDPAALSAFVLAGLVAGFALLGVTAWVWMRFDEHVARAIETLSSLMRTRAHAGVDTDLDQLPGRYLGDLAPACEALGSALSESRTALDVAVERETARLAADKLRLEAILRDLSEGVLVCNPAHAIMLYNRQAVALLGAGGDLGLDRPLFTLLRAAPVQHAFERLETLRRAGGGVREGRDLLCSTVDGARLLQARMSLIAGDDDVTDGLLGYVLTFRDITEDLAAHAERDRLLSEFVDTTRRPAANLQTTLDVLASLGDGDREMRRRLQDSMAGEIGAFAAKVGRLADRYDAGRARSWPMSSISANDVLDSIAVRFGQAGAAEEGAAEAPAIPRSGAGRRIEAGAGRSVEIVPAPGIRLHCDAFALVELIALLLRSLLAMGYAEHVRLSVLPNGEPGTATGPRARQGAPGEVCVALSWEGEVLPVAHLERWLAEPLHVGYGGFSGREALESHGTELWPEAEAGGRARLCLPLATAAERVRAAGIDERAEFYDFDLAAQGAAALGDDHLLSQLTLVVFDTETTGLEPSRGDEIVQIAAVRIVNGRVLRGEVFDALVHPGRRIPPASTRIHGITDAMVADAPPIGTVGRRFHDFCEGAVLVAHNAAFDLAFLRRAEGAVGRAFDHAVIDTVLLSALVYGQTESHTLDALAERLAVRIPPETRHTALGDSYATADVLVTLMPLLASKGHRTLGEVLRASAEMHALRRAQARY